MYLSGFICYVKLLIFAMVLLGSWKQPVRKMERKGSEIWTVQTSVASEH